VKAKSETPRNESCLHKMALVRYTAEQVAVMQGITFEVMKAAYHGDLALCDVEKVKVPDFLLYCEPFYVSVLDVVGGGELKLGSQVKQMRGQAGDCWADRYLLGEVGTVVALGGEDIILELACGTLENAKTTEVYLHTM